MEATRVLLLKGSALSGNDVAAVINQAPLDVQELLQANVPDHAGKLAVWMWDLYKLSRFINLLEV